MNKKNISKYFICTILILSVFLIFIFFYSKYNDNKKIQQIKNKHCNLIWQNLSRTQKSKTLNEYIENRIELDKHLREKTYSKNQSTELFIVLDIYQKYNFSENNIIIENSLVPEQIFTFTKNDAKIINIDNGLIEYSKNFLIKDINTKHKLIATIKYNAGCKIEKAVNLEIK